MVQTQPDVWADDSTYPATGHGVGLQADLGCVDPSCYIDRVEIARGGMGRITRARDRRLGRPVALKELTIDHPETRARLEREALLTAQLSHPAIVGVHEAGRWPDGRPFYAMKLVTGRSLDRVIADHETLASRLALLPHMLAVADALAYAHQQRVIHRDLKPHNVLVGEFGETVVIDWGLAKDLAAHEQSASRGRHASVEAGATIDGTVLGTPAYMPPEQANGEPVDERADVYAIGAMLYHLLAGQAPYGKMAGAAVVEILKEEAPAPLSEVAPDAPADLLAIVARAMARDPRERYADARGLADDLRRFHHGQLVGAHRYSWRELVRRWVRRNKRVVAVAAVSAAVLVAFGVVTLARIVRAEHRAQDERLKAERHRADAEELLDYMVGDLRDKLRPVNQLGLLDAVAHKARDYFEHRSDTLGDDDRRKHAVSLLNLGDVLAANGHTDAALAEYERAREIARGLVLVANDAPVMRDVLAMAHVKVGDMRKAQGDVRAADDEYRSALAFAPIELRYLRDVALAHSRHGDALLRLGDPAHALAEYRTELAIRHGVATTDPANPAIQRELANGHLRAGTTLRMQGDTTGALAEYRTALALGEAVLAVEPANALMLRDVGTIHERLGAAVYVQGDPAAALAEQRAALAIRTRLAENDPANVAIQRDLSVSHFKIADLLSDADDVQGALPHYAADLEITERLAQKDPSNREIRRDLLVSRSRYAGVLLEQGQPAAAVAKYRDALAIAQEIAASDPQNLMWLHDLGTSHRRLGDGLVAARDLRAAVAEFRIDLALSASLVARAPTNVMWQRDLSVAHEALAKTLLALGERREAIEHLEQDVTLAQRVAEHDPANAEWQAELRTSQELLASAQR